MYMQLQAQRQVHVRILRLLQTYVHVYIYTHVCMYLRYMFDMFVCAGVYAVICIFTCSGEWAAATQRVPAAPLTKHGPIHCKTSSICRGHKTCSKGNLGSRHHLIPCSNFVGFTDECTSHSHYGGE